MEDNVLCGIYDCTIKTKTESWPKLIGAIDKYLNREMISIDFSGNRELTIPNIYCLKDLFDIMCSLSEDKGDNWSLSSAVEIYLIYLNQTPQGRQNKLINAQLSRGVEFKFDDELIYFKNHLMDVLSSGKIRSLENAFKSEFVWHNTQWRRVDPEFLPNIGEPVIVLLSNGSISIDWVNEPYSNVPFAHYHVIGWNHIFDEHIKISKKQEV